MVLKLVFVCISYLFIYSFIFKYRAKNVFLNNITFNAHGWNFLLQSENSMTQHDYVEKAHPTAMNAQWQPGAAKLCSNAGRLFYFTLHPTHFKVIFGEELHSPGSLWYFSGPLSYMSKITLERESSARLSTGLHFPNGTEWNRILIYSCHSDKARVTPLLNETKHSLLSEVFWNV